MPVQRSLGEEGSKKIEEAQTKINELTAQRVELLARQKKLEVEVGDIANKSYQARLGAANAQIQFQKSFEDDLKRTFGKNEAAYKAEIKSQAEAADKIKDALDPLREKIRLQDELNQLVKSGFLTQAEADKYFKRQTMAVPKMLEAPSNEYQRKGLQLAGGHESNSREELKKQTDILAKIEQNTKVQRVATWGK